MSSSLTSQPVQPRPARAQHDDPEVALMLRVRAGEEGAFAVLVERLRPRVFGRLVKLLADRQDAEDLTQDVFMRLYRSRQRYVPTAKFSTWLYHITQNVARNAIRHRCRHAALRYRSWDFANEPASTNRTSPSERLERLELAALIHDALSGLMERQRAAVEMHEFQHRTYAEIAAALRITPEATKSLLYRARLQLRAVLGRFPDALDA